MANGTFTDRELIVILTSAIGSGVRRRQTCKRERDEAISRWGEK
jgi:hypothetical protein